MVSLFYGFDGLPQTVNYYVHADLFSQLVADFLRALSLVILEFPAVVWQQAHSRITDAGQVGKSFDPLCRADHIVTERPECLCFLIAGLYVPAQ